MITCIYISSFSVQESAQLVAVSPGDIILNPGQKLSIEVESSGRYFRHAWYKNNMQLYPNEDINFTQTRPKRFSEFFQVFVQDPTESSGHGVYRVELISNSLQVLQSLEFRVTPFSKFQAIGSSASNAA